VARFIGPEALVLLATPHGVFSWDFTVSRDGVAIAEIDMAWFRERADIKIGGQTFSLHRQSAIKGSFALQSGDNILAQAQKISAFSRAFRIDTAGRKLTLKATSAWRRQFEVSENETLIGRIGPTGWAGRTSVIDLGNNLPVPVQVFLFWLVVVLWRRADDAAATAAATASS